MALRRASVLEGLASDFCSAHSRSGKSPTG